jgi:formate-dependent nitrite reductase cytochrome c552 subunit
MNFKLLKNFILGICCILVLGAMVGIINAKAEVNPQTLTTEDCKNCHPVINEFWANGPHGAANVDCSTCHSPFTDHPDEVMSTDISSRLCGQCHTTTMDEWAESVHGQLDLTCVRCHDPHAASIKDDSVQALCEHCHSDLVHKFSFSDHAQQGLQCTDCHLQVDDSETRVGPGNRVHTFDVDLGTCVQCHQGEMHEPHQDVQMCDPEEREIAEEQGVVYPCDETEVTQAGLGIPLDEDVLAIEPQNVSPLGFTIIGTLAGVAAGIIAAPWLEKWFRRERDND